MYDADGSGEERVRSFAERVGVDPAEVPDRLLCAGGCGQNTVRIDEQGYMTTVDVWREAGNPDGFWCIGCLEQRLGRRLVRADFNLDLPLTSGPMFRRSERLRDRLAR